MKFPFRTRPTRDYLRKVVRAALREDLGGGDITTRLTVSPRLKTKAFIICKQPLVVAGLGVAREVFREVDPKVTFLPKCKDGTFVSKGTIVAEIKGKARSILTGERVALNFLQRLSGIATLTRKFVDEVKGTGVKIIDTRKTTPSLRILEKYAVCAGGGYNHRLSLSQLVLIKDNHIRAAGGVENALRLAVTSSVPVEVEVTPEVDLETLRGKRIDIVMLDNWSVGKLREAIRKIRHICPGVLIEVSGGVNLRNVRSIARCRPDLISVGALTHSAGSVDISLEVI